MKKNIAVVTTRHDRSDVRIFSKQVMSLYEKYNIDFYVLDGKGNDLIKNINIIDYSTKNSILTKILFDYPKIIYAIILNKYHSVHFHDPDFLIYTPLLKLFKRSTSIYYDIHEDLPRQILTKPYLRFRNIISFFIEIIENLLTFLFIDKIFCATPAISNRFSFIKKNYVVANYPQINFLKKFIISDFKKISNSICYIGSISFTRGLKEILNLAGLNSIDSIELIGRFENSDTELFAKAHKNWNKINYHGILSQEKLFKIVSNSKAGLCLLHPTKNYLESIPVKIFEYMAIGLPVIYSNFPFWKTLYLKYNIGLNLNPLDVDMKKLNEFLNDSNILNETRINNVKVINKFFSWESQYKILISNYE